MISLLSFVTRKTQRAQKGGDRLLLLHLFRLHLHKMLEHLVSQILVNLHLLILEFLHHLGNLIGIIAFAEGQITSTLVYLKEITICCCHMLPHSLQLHQAPRKPRTSPGCHMLPHSLQLHLLPHLVQYTPAGIQLLKLFKYVDWHIHFLGLKSLQPRYRLLLGSLQTYSGVSLEAG